MWLLIHIVRCAWWHRGFRGCEHCNHIMQSQTVSAPRTFTTERRNDGNHIETWLAGYSIADWRPEDEIDE